MADDICQFIFSIKTEFSGTNKPRTLKVVALSLRPNYLVTAGMGNKKSTEIAVDFLQERVRRGSKHPVYNVLCFRPGERCGVQTYFRLIGLFKTKKLFLNSLYSSGKSTQRRSR